MPRTAVAMPVKPFDRAKSRLAGVLSNHQRERCAQALFLRTQRFFAGNYPGFDRVVITASPRIQALSARVAASCVMEPAVEGVNKAATRAIDWASRHGYERLILIPGDVPVWVRSEVNLLLECAELHDVVVARAHDGGTNALVLSLPTPFECRYGPNSAARHVEAGRSAGLTAALCRPAFLARDLDTPEDLLLLGPARRPVGTA